MIKRYFKQSIVSQRVFWSLCAFLFFAYPSFGNTIFKASSEDPYLSTSFNQEANLQQLLSENSGFTTAFTTAFEKDFNSDLQYETLKTMTVDDWEMALFEKRNKQITFLQDYELSEELVSYIKTEINYNYWHLLLAYSINRSNENTDLKIVTSLPRVMTDALKKERINNDDLLISKSFRSFLPYFVIYFNSQEKGFKKYASGSKSLKDKGEYAMENLKGNTLDYTLHQVINLSAATLTTQTFSYWTSQIYEESLRDQLEVQWYDIIAENEEKLLAAEKEKASKKNKSNLPSLTSLDDKEFTFEKYKGKVIYVDFWASWCGPCRKEFPYSKEMHESLSKKQAKEIVFLYISTDQDLEAWKKAVEKLGLAESGVNAHSYEVGAKYQIRSIPRYMIIDKKGEIVNPNAPRPSNPETLQQLLELL